MKITSVEVFLLQKNLSSTMRISRGGFKVRTHALVQVNTDAGVSGLGEGVGNAVLVKAIVEAQTGRSVVGLDPLELEPLRQALLNSQVYYERKGSAICAASAIEMACWDIQGKVRGVPCHQLLGGAKRDRIPAYASDIYWEQDPAAMARNAERIVQRGYRAVKAHLGCRPPAEETERIAAIRDAIGGEIGFMVDLNAGYDLPQAERALVEWERFDLGWLEEPVHPDQVAALAELRQRSVIPIAAGENEFGVAGFNELFERGGLDVAMPDLGRAGGIQETREICRLARTRGVAVSPHNFSSGVLLAATIQLMAALPETTLLEMDTSGNAVYEEVLAAPLTVRDGNVLVSNEPGLGVKLTAETLNKYAPQST